MANNLDGQVAPVTGADSGIGHAVALELARAGADIVIAYHSDVEGAEVSARDVAATGRRVLTLQTDVRDRRVVAGCSIRYQASWASRGKWHGWCCTWPARIPTT